MQIGHPLVLKLRNLTYIVNPLVFIGKMSLYSGRNKIFGISFLGIRNTCRFFQGISKCELSSQIPEEKIANCDFLLQF